MSHLKATFHLLMNHFFSTKGLRALFLFLLLLFKTSIMKSLTKLFVVIIILAYMIVINWLFIYYEEGIPTSVWLYYIGLGFITYLFLLFKDDRFK